jgi:hypothetical protein
VTVRTALRAAVLTATTALLVLTTSPALAAVTVLAGRDDGDDPGSGLTVVQTLGVFVGIPLGLFLVIAILAAAPGASRRPRYRPGAGWWAAPVWFNGPDEAERRVRDGATPVSTEGGGASARW